MYYPKCKIYNDGGHFIAIPPTTRPFLRKRPKPLEKLIAVVDKNDDSEAIFDKENCKAKDEKSVNKPIISMETLKNKVKKTENEMSCVVIVVPIFAPIITHTA